MREFIVALALIAAPVAGKPLTAAQQAQLEANLARGDLLYAYDQAAWHVTDAALKVLPKEAPERLRGYIVTPDPNGYRTTFYGGEKGRYFRGYTGVWTGEDVKDAQLYPLDGSVPVTAEEARLIDARTVALASATDDLFLCSKSPPNSAVIPGPSPNDPISVYVMTPQTENGIWPLGGHHRIDIKDGKIVGRRAFTRSCIDLGGSDSRDNVALVMSVTHSLDPVPTEIHAFTVHTSKTPVLVATDHGIFVLGRKDGKVFAEQDE